MDEGLNGGCDCGAVCYTITAPVKLTVNCHCYACRRRNGASFSTYCVVPEEGLAIVQGEEQVRAHEPSETGKKHFCAQCGSPLYNANKRYPGVLMVHYGTLTGHEELTPRFNIYCESELPWVEELSGLRSFEQDLPRK